MGRVLSNIPGVWVQFQKGNAELTGWTVTQGNVDLVQSEWKSFEGAQSIDLVGYTLGGLQQTFNTTSGSKYHVSFKFANNSVNGPGTAKVELTGQSVLLSDTISHSNSDSSNMNWVNYTADFVADSNTTTLKLTALTKTNLGGIVIDDVAVYQNVQVTFMDGTTTLGIGTLNSNGVATLTTSGLSVGIHSIKAVYPGNTNFTTSTSAALSQLIQSATSTTLGSNANPSTFGQSTTFTATVAGTAPGAVTPTGTVTFKDGTTTLGTSTLNASGVATLLTTNLAIGSHSITAIYPGDSKNLASISTTFLQDVVSGSASSLTLVAGNNQSTTVASDFATQLQVKATEANGNPVSNTYVTFKVVANGAGGAFVSSTSVMTNASGIAMAPKLIANTVAGSFTVTASATGVANMVFNLTNTAGAVSTIVPTSGNNQTATVKTAFGSPLIARLLDSYGNSVSGISVAFTEPSSGAMAVFAGSSVVKSDGDGIVVLPMLSANTVSGSYMVTASVSNVSPAQFRLTNLAGLPTSIIKAGGNNQGAIINSGFPTPLYVTVLDIYGNLVPNVNVTFSAPVTGSSLTFAGPVSVTTNALGVAISPLLMANSVIGIYNVQAYVNEQASATFAMSNLAPTVQSMVVQQGTAGRSFVRYIDLTLNDFGTVGSIVSSLSGTSPKITLTNTGLTGTTKKAVTLKGFVTAIGKTIHIDFGTKGLGGNTASNAADGSYLISLDLDSNGSLETTQRFWRLLGDVNGTKMVDTNDTALVNKYLNKTGINVPGDTNGDGKVNSTDVSYVKKAQKRRISV